MSKGGAIRWTPQQLDEFRRKRGAPAALTPAPAKPKRSKYGARKVEQDGTTFDSSKEARRWAELEQMQKAGQISELRRQVAFVLAPAVKLKGEARTKPALRYFADAVYVQDGQMIVEDTKSAPTRKTAIYRAKLHLMKTVLNLDVKET